MSLGGFNSRDAIAAAMLGQQQQFGGGRGAIPYPDSWGGIPPAIQQIPLQAPIDFPSPPPVQPRPQGEQQWPVQLASADGQIPTFNERFNAANPQPDATFDERTRGLPEPVTLPPIGENDPALRYDPGPNRDVGNLTEQQLLDSFRNRSTPQFVPEEQQDENVPLPPQRPLEPPEQFPSPRQNEPPLQDLTPTFRDQPQQQQQSVFPQPPSMIDTFDPFGRAPVGIGMGPTFGIDPYSGLGNYSNSDADSGRRTGRTVGANYNGPLVDQYGNPRFGKPRFGGRGDY